MTARRERQAGKEALSVGGASARPRRPLGLDLCLCGHERRGHVYAADRRRLGTEPRTWRQCKRLGCPCARFAPAPFERQQCELFGDEPRRALLADFGRDLVDVLETGEGI